MKILIQSINFSPELTGIGKYTSDMADWLASRGHDVHVVTAPPYYPRWQVSEGYKNYFWSFEKFCNINVWRCPIWVPRKPRGITRLLHLASFAITSFPVMLRQVLWCPNVIISIEPPFFSAPAAVLIASITGAKSILHIQDYEIDAAFDLGFLNGKFLKKYIPKIERFILIRFDYVSTISSRMIEKAIHKGLDPKKVFFFPNWANISSEYSSSQMINVKNIDEVIDCRIKLGLPLDGVIALYSGNMGAKQGLEILAQVAKLYKLHRSSLFPLHFVFCGDGVGRENLEEQCKDFDFVHFLDLQPLDTLPIFLSAADIHLLPQRSDASDLVMPSKLTGMLASGRAVLATAHIDTELASIVQLCGIVVPPEDPKSFFEALVMLGADAKLRDRLGSAGYAYAIENLSRNRVLATFEEKLYAIILQ